MEQELQAIHHALQALARRMDALEARSRSEAAATLSARAAASAPPHPAAAAAPGPARAGGAADRAAVPAAARSAAGAALPPATRPEAAGAHPGPAGHGQASAAGGAAGSAAGSAAGDHHAGGESHGPGSAGATAATADDLPELLQAGFAALDAAEDLKAIPRFFARYAHENGMRMLLLKRWNSGLEVLLAEGLSKSRQMATEDPASERIATKDDDLFAALAQDHCVYAGPVPTRHFPLDLSLLLGRGPERRMVLLPLPLRGRWNTFIFLDCPADRPLLLAATECLARSALARLMLLEHGERPRAHRTAAILAQEMARRSGEPLPADVGAALGRRPTGRHEKETEPDWSAAAEPERNVDDGSSPHHAPPRAPAPGQGARTAAEPAHADMAPRTPAESAGASTAPMPGRRDRLVAPAAAPAVSAAAPLRAAASAPSAPAPAPAPASPPAHVSPPGPVPSRGPAASPASASSPAPPVPPSRPAPGRPFPSPGGQGLGIEEAFPLTRPARPGPRTAPPARPRPAREPGEGPLGSSVDLDFILGEAPPAVRGPARTAPAPSAAAASRAGAAADAAPTATPAAAPAGPAQSPAGPARAAGTAADLAAGRRDASVADAPAPTGAAPAGVAVHADLQAFLGRVGELPALPRVANHILALIADPNTTAVKLEKAIILDQALTAKILRIANSSFYGGLRDVNTVSEAIVRLGFVTIRNWTLVTAAKAVFVDAQTAPALQQVWQQSVLSAMASQLVAERVHFRAPEAVFVGGLMQNIGQLALAKAAPDVFRQVMESSAQAQVPYHVVERELLGFDHGDLGALLIREWNLSDELEAAVRQHHRLDEEGPSRKLAAMIGLGEEIAFCSGSVPDEALTIWEMSTAARILDIDEPTYVDLLERARQLRIDPRLFS